MALYSNGSVWDDGRMLVDSSPRVQSFVRFGGIFGDEPGQIPFGAVVSSATLSLQTSNSFPSSYSGTINDIDIYRMDAAWDSQTRWSDLSTLNDSVGLKNKATYIWTLEGPLDNWEIAVFDVTSAVQQWCSGAASNFGFGLVNESSDGADFWKGDHEVIADRPLLSITYTTPEPATICLLLAGGLFFRKKKSR